MKIVASSWIELAEASFRELLADGTPAHKTECSETSEAGKSAELESADRQLQRQSQYNQSPIIDAPMPISNQIVPLLAQGWLIFFHLGAPHDYQYVRSIAVAVDLRSMRI